jgi:molybdopterin converting factor small subunit
LRKLTGDLESIEVPAPTVAGVLEHLDQQYPGFRDRLFDGSDHLKQFINIYIDGEDIRFLDGLNSSVPERAEVMIVPAVAGG